MNLALFFAAFRLMTVSSIPTRALRAGVVLAGVVWTILQSIGGYYIGHVLKKSSGTYAEFALVIALIIWLHLGAQMTLYAAEVNVVLSSQAVAAKPVRAARASRRTRRRCGRWPRSRSAIPTSRSTSSSRTDDGRRLRTAGRAPRDG